MSVVPELPKIVELAVPFFIGSMLLEIAVARLRGTARYETRDTMASLVMGGGNLVEGALFGVVSYVVLMAFYPLRLFDLGWSWPVFLLCFVLDDLRYYWYHRIAHERRWFWAGHITHHTSQHYNLSTALRQTWSGTLDLSVVFRIPLVLLGFHPVMLIFVGGFNLIYQFWIHTEAIRRLPRWFEAVMNTPSHHRVHHATNARYLDSNYAGTFIVWDRFFGTFVAERDEEPCRYGVVKNLGTFNPLRIAFHEWAAMVRDVVSPGLTLDQRVRYLMGPPGYSHDGSRETTAAIKERYVQAHPGTAGQPGLPGEVP